MDHRGNVPVGGTSLYSYLTKIGQYSKNYLLGHAKWEMNSDVVLQWLHTRVWRRWQELIVLCEPLMDHLTGLLAHGTVVRPFFGGKLDVCASAALMVWGADS